MTTNLHEELADAVFRAALEPQAWTDVMRLMRDRFPSAAQTFYFLQLQPRRVRPICLLGVEPRWRDAFDASYFAPDNPWIRLTEQLHRPGVVRTNERLEHLLGDATALYRSTYYNEWMRPQCFKYTIGNTLYAEQGAVANITLLRAPDMATFDDAEVRAFEALSLHLTRSLQMSVRLEKAESGSGFMRAFDALPQPVALVDAEGRLLYANPMMEVLLRARRGLALSNGMLRALQPSTQHALKACIARALDERRGQAAAPLIVRGHCEPPLTLAALPVGSATGRFLASRPMVLLMASRAGSDRPVMRGELKERYGFTAAESRLAQALAQGSTLRRAAEDLGIGYGTARGYLKVLFEKTQVHSQAQLVGRILRDTAV